jgi:hypothetical protein
MKTKILTAIIIFLIILYQLTIFYIDKNMANRITQFTYDNCHKIWSARGHYKTRQEQNSLTSFNRAFTDGNIGIELDFYYDEKLNKFIISHDRPTVDKQGNLHYALKAGKLLTLEEVFQKIGKDHYFWLDYKNLDRISNKATSKAIARLEEISQIHHVKERAYVEGSNPIQLAKYTKQGFNTIFAFQPLSESSVIASLSSNIYKIAYYFFDLTVVGMPYGPIDDPKYGPTTRKNLQGIPTFLFHVPNDEALLKELMKMKDVRVVLVGKDLSINRANINACKN